MSLLSFDQIVGTDDISHKDVEVKEWGGTVRLKQLTSGQRDAWEAKFVVNKDKPERYLQNLRADLVARCLVDEDGKRLFDDKQVAKLADKSPIVVNLLFEEARKLNGLSDADVEELEGNSESAPD